MSDAYRVAYAPEALDDLKAIYTYLAQVLQAPGTAQELWAACAAKFARWTSCLPATPW